jgi:threonine/homoserine/homoserine lactone efflux protein
MSALWAFALTSLIVELTPGPNMAWLALVAAAEGRRKGYAAVAGVALGLAVVGVLAASGLAALIAASPAVYQVLRLAGAGWLLWLAWEGWRGERGDGDIAPGQSMRRWFRRGLVTNLLNPKAAVFYIAVLPEFMPDGGGLTDALVLSAIYVAVATAVHAGIVTVAGLAHRLLADPVREKVIRRVLSLSLVGVALWMLTRT